MDARVILHDLTARPLQALDLFWDDLGPARLNAHVAGHPNSIAWLVWHTGREIDAQVADLAGTQQVWTTAGFVERFALDGVDSDAIGHGMSAEDAARVCVPETAEGKALLREYVEAAVGHAQGYLDGVTADELARVIDDSYDPPVTVAVRYVSVIVDAMEHLGQAAYAAGTTS